uniref:Biogenesis of lysosome-related organelles complex 1 subunit 1 n=1 Tax=Ciona intestinalis TaxID=7719 RepID=H2XRU3_CIOIN|nr:biogenesis of lysosome-related organelles complex 1 subunit 1-like [Ciona intestinalis]|eukprot:XP_002122157.1 biogenesis of lysosome-related organelles complex 1 subunit 1-like [Ciona intestinalis]
MLSSMLKDHRVKQRHLKDAQEKRRQEAVSSLYKFNEGIMASINSRVSAAYVNQCQLDNEMKQLEVQTSRFNKLTTQWASELNSFHNALKEIGDVENWALSIESDLRLVTESLEYINNKNNSNTSKNS